jgi:peptidoglycan/LPS O-acetylase OafA/YrhL
MSALREDVPATPATPRRFEELEAYRGVAALLIVVFHAYQFSREGSAAQRYVYEGTWLHYVLGNLDAGVAFFFALSGFLVFLPFARAAIDQRGRQSARGYLIRRMIRIAPLYYAAIMLAWSLTYHGMRDQWIDLAEHLTFTQVFDSRHIFWDIGPAWSLSDELLFYLLVAVLGSLAYRACRRLSAPRARVRVLLGCCLGLVALSVGYKAAAFYVLNIPRTDYSAYFGPLARLDTFASGMVVAVLTAAAAGRPRIRVAAAATVRVAAFAVIGAAFATRTLGTAETIYFHTFCGFGVALLLASTALAQRELAWTRIVADRRIQVIGLISYSVYMWHEPLMTQLARHNVLISAAPRAFPANALALIAATLAVAYVSYRIIEKPALQLRHLFTRDGRWAEYYPPEPREYAASSA